MKDNEIDDTDKCPICGQEIDLCRPHAFDRDNGRAVHRACESSPKNERRNSLGNTDE
jgi:hypothetical protein